MLAFKYRVHDAQLGRFLSIDPLAPDYPWNSPYAFSENRVINGVELEGLERVVSISNDFLGYGPFGNNGVTMISHCESVSNNSDEIHRLYLANSPQTLEGRDVKVGHERPPTGITTLSDDDIGRVLAFGTQVISNNFHYFNAPIMTAMEESVGNAENGHYGLLDFKFVTYDLLSIPADDLLEINGTVYNANEAGNYLWGMVLEFNNILINPAWAADRQSRDEKGEYRPDEAHEQKAIRAGIEYAQDVSPLVSTAYSKYRGSLANRLFLDSSPSIGDVERVIANAKGRENQVGQGIERKRPSKYSGN